MSRFFALAVLVALCVPGLVAQISLSGSGHSSRHTSFGISGSPAPKRMFSGVGEGMRRHRSFAPFFYGSPYFYSDYNEPNEPYEQPYRGPQFESQPVPATPVKNEPLPDPLLLELRGGRWVKVTTFDQPSQIAASAGHGPRSAPQKETPPAVLVYRDGRTQEVSSYSIIGRVIYTKADYWTEGSWTRQIEIADLDVPATLQQNHQRGVRFDLPSGPDEVVIRP